MADNRSLGGFVSELGSVVARHDASHSSQRSVALSLDPPVSADLAVRFHAPIPISSSLRDDLIRRYPVAELAADGHYLNIRFDLHRLANHVCGLIAEQGDRYGAESPRGQRVVIEHTSLTPTYPINLTTFRSSALGNALRFLLTWAGYSAQSRIWVADLPTRQLEAAVAGMRWQRLKPETWHGKYDHTIGAAFTIGAGLVELSAPMSDVSWAAIRRMFPFADVSQLASARDAPNQDFASAPSAAVLAKLCLHGHAETLRRAGIQVDGYDRESAGIPGASAEALANELLRMGVARRDDDGSIVLPAAQRPWVLVDQRQRPSYLLRSLAYALLQQEHDTHYVAVISARQSLIVKAMEDALCHCKKDGSAGEARFILYGDVLFSNHQRDSLRAHTFHSVDGVVADLANNGGDDPDWLLRCLYFALLQVPAQREMTLRAAQVESSLRRYVEMYRAIRRLRELHFTVNPHHPDGESAARKILLLLWSFPDTVAQAADELRPQLIMRLLTQIERMWEKCAHDGFVPEHRSALALGADLLAAMDVCLRNLFSSIGFDATDLLRLIGPARLDERDAAKRGTLEVWDRSLGRGAR